MTMKVLVRLWFLGLFCLPLNAFGYSIQDAEESLRSHQYDQVLNQIKPEEIDDASDRAYAQYLLASAAFDKEDYERALPLYEKICTDYADSRWFVKAIYRKAECLMFLKKFPSAEAIYAAGVQGLMSEKRRNEIADIYIRHADEFYAPPKKDQEPFYDRARTLYQFARDILPKGAAWERASYQIAMTFFKQEQWEESQKSFQDLIAYYESHTIKSPAEKATGEVQSASAPNPYPAGGYLDDAQLNRGEAFFRLNNMPEARKIWKKMRDQRREVSKRPEIIAEAAFRVAKTYGMPEQQDDKNLALGIRSLDEFLRLFANHEKVATASLQKAQAYFNKNQTDKALSSFREFLELYKNKATPEQTAFAEIHIAHCLMNSQKFDEAIQAFQEFLTRHPVDKNWSDAQQAIVETRYRKIDNYRIQAEKELRRWKRKIQDEKKDPQNEPIPAEIVKLYDSLRESVEAYQKEYPLDGKIPHLQLMLGNTEQSIHRYANAIQIWRDIATRYPNSDVASNALFSIASCTEKDLGDLEKAIDFYQEVTFGQCQGFAQNQIKKLKEIRLSVRTEQSFRTNEKPVIQVNTRNVESFTCKLYPLDLRAYFETRHSIRKIEDLDVNLIASEKVWEVTPEKYASYKPITQDIPIPVDGAGAWVVKVESKTLEAVTLVLVSDLAIAIKGGKQEVFVYAEDQKKEQPVSGAEILVHDGQSIVAQGRTNADGVFHVRDLKGAEVNELSVFAISEKNCASERLRIGDLNVKTTLQPRILIYTDRPAYQPGDSVQYRALIREIKDGKYIVPEEVEFEVAAVDARGTLIHQQQCKLSPFGTLHGNFLLDKGSPVGPYRITVSRKDGPSGTWEFNVQEFTLPTARIDIETAQNTYFYGDKIAGTIQVRDFSGNALANEKVSYLLVAEQLEAVTDKEGKISFEFETWDLPEEGGIFIQATLPNRQIQGAKNLLLVTTGYSISLETNRTLYLAGEPFQVQVTARSRDDKQTRIAQSLKVILQRKNNEGVYEDIDSEPVTTSADERKISSVSFTVKTGGEYRIIAEGTDARGTRITLEKNIFISGEEDENKLLVLSDRSTYQQGETATFTVVSRVPDNLVLMTGEREGVVEYRIEKLQHGKNTVSWKLDDRYSPTCVISFTMMNGNRVYNAETRFQVRRGLDVVITPNAQKYGPQDETELSIETRDHTGKPVVTEFSLGLVDKALLALFPDRLGNIAAYFGQAARGRFLAFASSADFSYTGITRPINDDLLLERVGELETWGFDTLGDTEGGLRKGVEILKEEGAVKELMDVRADAVAAAPALKAGLQERGVSRIGVNNRNAEAKFEVAVSAADGIVSSDAANRPAAGRVAGEPTPLSVLAAEPTKDGFATQSVQFMKGDPNGDTIAGVSLKYAANADRSAGAGGAYFYGGYGMMGGTGLVSIRAYFPKSAYFNPCIITDDSGKATIRVKLPDTLTTWEAQARAITQDTLVNQGKTDVVVDKSFRVDWEAPTCLTEGDQASGVVRVRNNSGERQTGKLSFTQLISDREKKKEFDFTLAANETHQEKVVLSAESVGDSTVTVGGNAGVIQDSLSKPLTIEPWGIPVRVGDSGIGSQSIVKELSLPSQANYSSVKMWLTLSGVGDISLLSSAWSGGEKSEANRSIIEKGLAALAALDCAEQLKKNDLVPVELLRQQAESAVRHAVAAQSDQGLWAWGGGQQSAQDILTTGRVTELLRRAKDRGITVPGNVLELAASRLDALYQETPDDRLKIQILYAWSFISQINFAFANRLHRNLSRMEAYDAALLGLTWLNMDRIDKAQEVLNYLLEPGKLGDELKPVSQEVRIQNRHEAMAAAARLYFLLPASVRTDAVTQRFLNALSTDSGRFTVIPMTPVGLRVQALAAYLKSAAEERQSFEIAVKVNGQEIAKRRASQAALAKEEIAVDSNIVKPGKNRVELAYQGQGRYRYAVVLEGWTKQDVKPQQWLEPQEIVFTDIERRYEHGPLMVSHQEIPRGYSVISGSYQVKNFDLKELEYGERSIVRIRIASPQEQNYVIVRDRLPAGCAFLKESLQGPVDHYDLQDNTLTLYLRSMGTWAEVTYQLRGLFPGTYRVPPALIVSSERPEQIYATSSSNLVVLEEGKSPKEAYPPTPDELYNLGLRYFDEGNYEKAETYLTALMNSYSLQPDPYLESARKLFQIHLKSGNAKELVRYFEIIKERDKEFEIQFDQIAALAKAYRDIGEQERAVYVYRSLLEGLFKQEGAVSGTLQEAGRYREALDYAKQLILQYPDIPTVQTAVYTTGSVIYKNLNEWAKEPNFIQSGNDRKTLLAEAVGMIQSFLALYPGNPAADEAGYTLINLWLDQKNYEKVSQLTESYAAWYPKSSFLDSFDYLRAYALFQLERYTQAIAIAEKVSSAEYPAPGGGMRRSDEANNAIHIAGKILHASGELERALEQYERVKESFGDAAESIAYLKEKGLSAEDVTLLKNQEPASIRIRHKNIEKADLSVYKVNLMAFYLTERDLGRMADINLAGITPIIQQAISFSNSDRHDWKEEKIGLALNDPGAYLIVLRGDGVSDSGMIVRSDLKIEVQEDVAAGSVRVNVEQGEQARLVKDVKVQVRGSDNDRFTSGTTDLRGVYSASGIQGTVTVLAQLGDQYGFYRGTTPLSVPAAAAEVEQKAAGQEKAGKAIQKIGEVDALFSNAARMNQLQERQQQQWKDATDSTNNSFVKQKADSLY